MQACHRSREAGFVSVSPERRRTQDPATRATRDLLLTQFCVAIGPIGAGPLGVLKGWLDSSLTPVNLPGVG